MYCSTIDTASCSTHSGTCCLRKRNRITGFWILCVGVSFECCNVSCDTQCSCSGTPMTAPSWSYLRTPKHANTQPSAIATVGDTSAGFHTILRNLGAIPPLKKILSETPHAPCAIEMQAQMTGPKAPTAAGHIPAPCTTQFATPAKCSETSVSNSGAGMLDLHPVSSQCKLTKSRLQTFGLHTQLLPIFRSNQPANIPCADVSIPFICYTGTGYPELLATNSTCVMYKSAHQSQLAGPGVELIGNTLIPSTFKHMQTESAVMNGKLHHPGICSRTLENVFCRARLGDSIAPHLSHQMIHSLMLIMHPEPLHQK